MPPKQKDKMKPNPGKTKRPERTGCTHVQGEKFYAHIDEISQTSWWEICCFPYILCTRVWDCCMAICAGTNQCMVYWMLVQWCVCKITRITTPDAIIFPYYFYIFCQVILLTIFFVLLWKFVGSVILIPYLYAIYDTVAANFISNYTGHFEANKTKLGPHIMGHDIGNDKESKVEESLAFRRRLKFRRYCFKKSELFEETIQSPGKSLAADYFMTFVCVLFEVLVDRFVL